MSLAKRDPKLATAGLAAATVLVFGATAAFAATSSNRAAPKSRTTDQFSHGGGAAYAGAGTGAGAGVGSGTGTGSGGASGSGAGAGNGSQPESGYGLGPHGDQTVKDSAGQWVEQVWQTGKVIAVGDGELKVTDVTGLTWEWTVSPTAEVGTDHATGAVRVGDSVTVEGTQAGTVHTATDVTDHGVLPSQ